MVDEKIKPVAKKASSAKPKAATTGTVSKKAVEAESAAVTKKKVTVKKKTNTDVLLEEKKTKPASVKKVSVSAEKEKVAKAVSAKPKTSKSKHVQPTPEERYRMVEMAAYFIAEKHGFQGRSDAHWAAAEREIAQKLGEE